MNSRASARRLETYEPEQPVKWKLGEAFDSQRHAPASEETIIVREELERARLNRAYRLGLDLV